MAISIEAQNAVLEAVKQEYLACVGNHGAFRNHHEAYAVLLEELEEVLDEMGAFYDSSKFARKMLWGLIKGDKMSDDDSDSDILVSGLKSLAIIMIQEAVQVAAVSQKWLDLIDRERAVNRLINGGEVQ